MTLKPHLVCALAALSCATAPALAIEEKGGGWVFGGKNWALVLDARGSIVSSRGASARSPMWKSGEFGLWRARLRDNTFVSARDATEITPTLSPDNETLSLKYFHSELEAVVTATERADGVDWRATVAPASQAVTEFALPARLRWSAPLSRRLVTPALGHDAPGLALKPLFFARQGERSPSGWQPQLAGSSAYTLIFGDPPVQHDMAAPAVLLQLTAEGARYLGPGAEQVLAGRTARVARPMTREQADVVLIDSASGPFLSGSRLKSANGGLLWRVGAIVEAAENAWVAQIVGALAEKVASEARASASSTSPDASPSTSTAPGTRDKIGLLALKRAPERGSLAGVSVAQWRTRLRAAAGEGQFEEIADLAAFERALAGRDFAVILNPYGEAVPTGESETPGDVALRVAAWVKSGGHWIETGGFSFFQALRPQRFFSYGGPYPGTFAHFFHLDGVGSSSALFCVQPQRETGWRALENPALALVPSQWKTGGDDSGAFLDAPWTPWVEAKASWTSPISRLIFGGTALQNGARHARDNEITRTLRDKMPPALLARFKGSVLLYIAGSAQSKQAALKYLPPGTTLHFADYLKGGFDKEYPDHLPPNQSFGTLDQAKALFDAARKAGHLVVPYTNPTWWCDNPPGPTFVRAGRDGLLLNVLGQNAREAYEQNDGWTTTLWHPEVRAANQMLREQFTRDLPVDILFQDQVGAREARLDFNPASPTPHAYNAGLLAQAQEDAAVAPLSTENGWDHLALWESQMCGFSFSTVPTEGGPSWRQFLRDRFPADSFEIFPLAQAMAHDKLAFIHHDLGQFVTNREVLAWTLALGFNMSFRSDASALASDDVREWLKYLDRVQKTICAPAMGAGIQSWEYLNRDTIDAKYGAVSVTSVLNPSAISWRASSPQVLAVDDGRNPPVISARRADGRFDVWLYGPPAARAMLRLPNGARATSVRWDGQPKGVPLVGVPTGAPVVLPARDSGRIRPPQALSEAPQNWKATPKIGVIEMAGVGTPWSDITPAQWKTTLQESRLATEFGIEIETLSTPAQVLAALASGPTKYFAIVNPHTEIFPASGRDKWPATLQAIKKYVEGGGHWWATGGYPFYVAAWPGADGKWQTQPVGPEGAGFLGLPVSGGEVEAAPQALKVEGEGATWLSDELKAKIAAGTSVVNRSLPREGGPARIALVGGASGTWIGGYRLNGWGGLWRVGGFAPNADLALPIARESLEYLWTHPSPPVRISTKYLWHGIVDSKVVAPRASTKAKVPRR
jgi:hypothetical protein